MEKVRVKTTNVFQRMEEASRDFSVISAQGGSRSGKTYNIVLWLVQRLLLNQETSCSIVRATLPALKGSVLRDFKDVLLRMELWDDSAFNKSDLIYTLPNKSWFEFFSTDSEEKLRGRKRDILFVNEANELTFIEWQQLQMRTTQLAILDYNPSFTDEHWISKLNNDEKTFHFITTYKDNPFLEQRVIEQIEDLRDKNRSLWTIYGQGQQSMVEGLIFTNWSLVEQIPPSVRKRYIGLDFGFTNHPSAAVQVGLDIEARAIYIHELFYSTHMLTDNLISALAPYREEIVSESADPRLIAELRNAGLWVTPVSKPAGSVQAGITKMQTFDIYITQSSHNVIREIKNYVWEQNRDGGFVNQPVKEFDHAMDAVRYVVYEKTLGRNVGPISKDDLGL